MINNIDRLVDQHEIWGVALLDSMHKHCYLLEDYQYIFSQYYMYSKNFTRFLSVAMLKSENDLHRAIIAKNIVEESGEHDSENRHSSLFEKFLIDGLDIDASSIKMAPFTQKFIDQYLHLCMQSTASECLAILAFATEGIVEKLYKIVKSGLISIGIKNDKLLFFDLHIECDDGHAGQLKSILSDYIKDETDASVENSTIIFAIEKALSIRKEFFNALSMSLSVQKIKGILDQIDERSEVEKCQDLEKTENYIIDIDLYRNNLYKNRNNKMNINFEVDRFDFSTTTIDPRMLIVEPFSTSEEHSHAHESIFLIIEGEGVVMLGKKKIPVEKNKLIYIPRWIPHQTINTSDKLLRIFAVTDYKLTKNFSKNNEASYRLKSKLIKES